MFKMTITAGTEFDRNGRRIADTDRKLRAIRQHIAARFGGFTEAQTFGGWINGAGELVMESGRQWTILTDDQHATRIAARQLGELVAQVLNQEAVVAEVTNTVAEFVGQPANDNAAPIAA